jgi:hypothetical protein
MTFWTGWMRGETSWAKHPGYRNYTPLADRWGIPTYMLAFYDPFFHKWVAQTTQLMHLYRARF